MNAKLPQIIEQAGFTPETTVLILPENVKKKSTHSQLQRIQPSEVKKIVRLPSTPNTPSDSLVVLAKALARGRLFIMGNDDPSINNAPLYTEITKAIAQYHLLENNVSSNFLTYMNAVLNKYQDNHDTSIYKYLSDFLFAYLHEKVTLLLATFQDLKDIPLDPPKRKLLRSVERKIADIHSFIQNSDKKEEFNTLLITIQNSCPSLFFVHGEKITALNYFKQIDDIQAALDVLSSPVTSPDDRFKAARLAYRSFIIIHRAYAKDNLAQQFKKRHEIAGHLAMQAMKLAIKFYPTYLKSDLEGLKTMQGIIQNFLLGRSVDETHISVFSPAPIPTYQALREMEKGGGSGSTWSRAGALFRLEKKARTYKTLSNDHKDNGSHFDELSTNASTPRAKK